MICCMSLPSHASFSRGCSISLSRNTIYPKTRLATAFIDTITVITKPEVQEKEENTDIWGWDLYDMEREYNGMGVFCATGASSVEQKKAQSVMKRHRLSRIPILSWKAGDSPRWA